ncbi:MAG: hypothetical protein M0R22_11960, partial [Dehalococcoidia bacterium]|nr:hypothetical protein [Dehalococcoidia bacterium]
AKEMLELTDGRVVSRSVVHDRGLPVIRAGDGTPAGLDACSAGQGTGADECELAFRGEIQTW